MHNDDAVSPSVEKSIVFFIHSARHSNFRLFSHEWRNSAKPNLWIAFFNTSEVNLPSKWASNYFVAKEKSWTRGKETKERKERKKKHSNTAIRPWKERSIKRQGERNRMRKSVRLPRMEPEIVRGKGKKEKDKSSDWVGVRGSSRRREKGRGGDVGERCGPEGWRRGITGGEG